MWSPSISPLWLESPHGDILVMMASASTSVVHRTIRVGDLVKLRFGRRDVRGTVIEDRGRIGVNGRRLLRVKVDLEPSLDPMELEIPATELARAG